jgi:hypothetical protein
MPEGGRDESLAVHRSAGASGRWKCSNCQFSLLHGRWERQAMARADAPVGSRPRRANAPQVPAPGGIRSAPAARGSPHSTHLAAADRVTGALSIRPGEVPEAHQALLAYEQRWRLGTPSPTTTPQLSIGNGPARRPFSRSHIRSRPGPAPGTRRAPLARLAPLAPLAPLRFKDPLPTPSHDWHETITL